jgi:ABC-type uncharacterized transport system permease subunit
MRRYIINQHRLERVYRFKYFNDHLNNIVSKALKTLNLSVKFHKNRSIYRVTDEKPLMLYLAYFLSRLNK